MNNRIKSYVDGLFSEIPRSGKVTDLKEDLLANMSESYENYIREGKTENEAYSLVISDLKDLDEMLADVQPDKNSPRWQETICKNNEWISKNPCTFSRDK